MFASKRSEACHPEDSRRRVAACFPGQAYDRHRLNELLFLIRHAVWRPSRLDREPRTLAGTVTSHGHIARQRLISQVIADAIVRPPNNLEALFREGVLTAGPPYTVVLQEPDLVVELPLAAQESFQELLEDLRKRQPARKVRDWEVQEQLLLALARVAAGSTRPSSIEALASRLLAGQPVVSVSELDGIDWLGPPIRLSEGVILGRISDGLETLLQVEVATDSPTFTMITDFYHPITEDFQGDRVDPPSPDDDYVGNYPVVLCLATNDRSPDNNALALRRLISVLGAALWLFSPPDRGFARPGARNYAVDTEREHASQHDCLTWAGGRWDSAPQDEIRQKIAAEEMLAGPRCPDMVRLFRCGQWPLTL